MYIYTYKHAWVTLRCLCLQNLAGQHITYVLQTCVCACMCAWMQVCMYIDTRVLVVQPKCIYACKEMYWLTSAWQNKTLERFSQQWQQGHTTPPQLQHIRTNVVLPKQPQSSQESKQSKGRMQAPTRKMQSFGNACATLKLSEKQNELETFKNYHQEIIDNLDHRVGGVGGKGWCGVLRGGVWWCGCVCVWVPDGPRQSMQHSKG